MLAVVGQPNVHLAARRSRAARRTDVEWVDIDDPDPTFPYTPGEPAPTTNNDAISYVGNQGGRRAPPTSRGSRARSTTTATSTSPRPRAAGRRRPALGPIAGGYGNGHGQIWAYRHPTRRRLRLVYQSPGPDVARLPRQRHRPARAARSSSARTTPTTTTSAGSPARRAVRHRPQPAASASTGADAVQRRVRRGDLQPRRRNAVRQHPGLARASRSPSGDPGAAIGV